MQVTENLENKNGYFSSGSVSLSWFITQSHEQLCWTVQKMAQGWDEVAKAFSAAA